MEEIFVGKRTTKIGNTSKSKLFIVKIVPLVEFEIRLLTSSWLSINQIYLLYYAYNYFFIPCYLFGNQVPSTIEVTRHESTDHYYANGRSNN